MKPFNLEEAKAGKPVCTRDGRPARIICFDKKWTYFPIVALVGHYEEDIKQYNKDGKSNCEENGETKDDLMMVVSEHHEGWINLCRAPLLIGSFVYDTKEEAESKKDIGCISTVKIEWEE